MIFLDGLRDKEATSILVSFFEEALLISRRLGQSRNMVIALQNIAESRRRLGRVAASQAALNEALLVLFLAAVLYNRFRIKAKANRELEEANAKISSQQTKLEEADRDMYRDEPDR